MAVRRSAALVAASVATAAPFLAGCGSGDEEPVTSRATAFYGALADGDARTACAALASQARLMLEEQEDGPCAEVILDAGLPEVASGGRVEVFGSMAQVTYEDETTFLSRYDEGWRITAAGCAPTLGEEPHDCTIEVG